MKTLVNVLLVCLLLAGAASAADLYRIRVDSPAAAERFAKLDLAPIAHLIDGYLVLAEPQVTADLLAEVGAELVARDVNLSELAFDMRKDRLNVSSYELLFEEGAIRLYRVPANLVSDSRRQIDLRAVTVLPRNIEYVTSRQINLSRLSSAVNLDSLIGLVSQDSLTAWTLRLQAYRARYTGTDSNYAAQTWVRNKFISFGFDSVYYDTFTTSVSGSPKLLRNVVATKVGTAFPNRHIVIGGHLDGVASSPAADDNGSGSVGTLEMARILASASSPATLIFMTFDGEEQGLYGSTHYADAAAASGDSILFMLNMDMIAHFESGDSANLYSGPDQTYVTLWQQLADSLVGINGAFAGVANNSDHAGFVDNGYTALFVHEGVFSTVYHSSQDSTTYMNFPYLTRMVKATLATAYVGLLDATLPAFDYVYSPNLPAFVYADSLTTIQLSLVAKNNAVPVSGSGRLNYSINSGTWQQVALTEFSPTSYQFTLPKLDCGDTLRYFISIEEASLGLLSDGSAANPYMPATITEQATSFTDNFQTDKGWMTEVIGATSGTWQRGVPVNDPNWHYTPPTDGDGSGSCFLTHNGTGNTDVDAGAVRLTSPAFTLTPSGQISYYYFVTLTNTAGAVDRLLVEVNNGQSSTWYPVALYTMDTGLEWKQDTIFSEQIVAAGAPLTSSMKIRFTANDADPQSVVEAGVDGIRVITYDCIQKPQYVCGDADANLTVDISDAVYLIAFIFSGGSAPNPQEAGDVNCDTAVDISDVVYLIAYIFSGGSAPCAGCEP